MDNHQAQLQKVHETVQAIIEVFNEAKLPHKSAHAVLIIVLLNLFESCHDLIGRDYLYEKTMEILAEKRKEDFYCELSEDFLE